jgi:hypothetical protein
MAEHNAVVGVYHSHTDAEAAVKELQKSGFNMQKLSIVGKDYQTEERCARRRVAGTAPASRVASPAPVWGCGDPPRRPRPGH